MAEMSNFISIMYLTLKWTMLIKKVQKVFFSNLLKIKKWNSAAISTASKHFLGTQFSLNLWKNSLYIITKTHLGNQELKNQRHFIPFREDIFVSNHICTSYLQKCMFVFPEKIFFYVQIHYWQSPPLTFPNHHKRMRGSTFYNYTATF